MVEAASPPPYRPVPPAAASVRWPDGFGTRFAIAVDVEEEFDWGAPLRRANRATTALAAFPDAHRRFADAGAGLACMIDYPIAVDPRAPELLAGVLADRRSEIGAQLHAWVTPPDEEVVSGRNSFQGNLPRTLEAAKIDRLTTAVAALAGRPPRAFRAGRYGIGPATHALLSERGYSIDLSPRARYDYSAEGGPDFGAVGNAAWHDGALVVLPATTVFTGRLRAIGARLHPIAARLPRAMGALARTGLLSRVPLTSEGVSAAEAVAAIDKALATGERLLLFGFHSPSLVPGHTPYVRDTVDLTRFWQWWDRVLAHLARRSVRHASIEEILAAR